MTAELGVEFKRRQYRQPPVVEAMARIHLAAPMPWDLTTPGLMYARLKEDYGSEPQFQSTMQAELATDQQGSVGANLQVTAGPQKVVFGNDNRSQLLIAGASDISVHGLQPYEGWESLERRLAKGIGDLGDLIGDTQVTGLGVRYINRIVIPATTFRFEDYLTIGFAMPPGFPPNVNAFLDRVESEYPDGKSKISFTWATTDSGDEESTGFLLDFDLVWSSEEPIGMESAMGELVALKRKETEAFESLLQPQLREMFGEIDQPVA